MMTSKDWVATWKSIPSQIIKIPRQLSQTDTYHDGLCLHSIVVLKLSAGNYLDLSILAVNNVEPIIA